MKCTTQPLNILRLFSRSCDKRSKNFERKINFQFVILSPSYLILILINISDLWVFFYLRFSSLLCSLIEVNVTIISIIGNYLLMYV
jgi:hypothetical protein